MSTQGNTAEWQEDLIAIQDIVCRVIMPEAWRLCCTECCGYDYNENKVTGILVKHLQKVKALRRQVFENTHFRIHPQTEVNSGEDDLGRIDIFVTPYVDDEEVYLAYECKWLCKDSSSASLYAGDDGIGRFLTGKYSSNVNVGNMIGYVRKVSLVHAAESVSTAMKNKSMPLPLAEYPLSSNMLVMRSTHNRVNCFGPIELTHILLPYCLPAP